VRHRVPLARSSTRLDRAELNDPFEVNSLKATEALHNLGQSIWLDNITRELLDTGRLKRYIDDLSVSGLTSNPTIFDHAIPHSATYDSDIRRLLGAGLSSEELFFNLAIEDLTRAADLFAPIHERTAGVDGWASLRSHHYLPTRPRQPSSRPRHFAERPTGATS
jgi:hypothetical protein